MRRLGERRDARGRWLITALRKDPQDRQPFKAIYGVGRGCTAGRYELSTPTMVFVPARLAGGQAPFLTCEATPGQVPAW